MASNNLVEDADAALNNDVNELTNDGEAEQSEETLQPQQKKHESEAHADLEKITDYEEDKEISSQDIANAVSLIEGKRSQERKLNAEKEKELAQVKIKKEDVDLIVEQMEIVRHIAERKLREHKGDIVQALIELTN